MFEIAETAKKMIVKLNEIQPAVSVAGLVEESDAIKEMKVDLIMLLRNITPDNPCMEWVLVALRQDVLSSSVALRDYLNSVHAGPVEMEDHQLRLALLAAESFVLRGRDYLDSKRKAFELTGGKYGRA
ncbi:MAG: hypothetical protein ACD_75C00843G0010 [uncultured bacterium]|nr:MAG: hypothetical protein ACD_75C00843G0010 [uncultured bacterium]